MLIHFLFSLFAVCIVEIRKPIALRLEVKMIALYTNVPNIFGAKWRKLTYFE